MNKTCFFLLWSCNPNLTKSISIPKTFSPKSYVTFASPMNQTLIAYFLQPGDELLLIWHIWFDNIVPTVVVESDNIIELSRFQFHQRFYVRIFHTNIDLAAFSSYVLALSKNPYEKRARKMLMKLTAGFNFTFFVRKCFAHIFFSTYSFA